MKIFQSEVLPSKTLNLVIDTIIMVLSIFFIISTIIETRNEKKIKLCFIKIFSCEFIYALVHFLAIFFKGKTSGFSFFIVNISNFLEFSLIFILFLFFSDYIFLELKNNKNKKKERILIIVFTIIGVSLNIINLFTHFIYYIDESNIYHRGELFFLPTILMYIYCFTLFLIIIINYKNLSKRILIAFILCIILPLIGSIIQYFVYGYSFVIIGLFISTIYIFFSMIINESNKKANQEKELLRINNQIMLNQINPHFLFNALTSIMYLCDKDSQEAKNAIHDFSIYLRNNLDSIASFELIPFQKELEHIDTYLKIENRRFNNKIEVFYELDYIDFFVPPLSIETLVENSVKHGFFLKEHGILTIKSYIKNKDINIEIIDNGTGFDVDEVLKNLEEDKNRKSYGLMTSIKRLKQYFNATIKIESKINEGTIIKICFKKDEK